MLADGKMEMDLSRFIVWYVLGWGSMGDWVAMMEVADGGANVGVSRDV